MSLLTLLFGEKKNTASVAKERLQLIIAREHSSASYNSPDFLVDLQRDLIEVISKYVKVNPNDIKVRLEREGNYEMLDVNIVLPDSPAQNPASPAASARKRPQIKK